VSDARHNLTLYLPDLPAFLSPGGTLALELMQTNGVTVLLP
jgi:hypothetical protein